MGNGQVLSKEAQRNLVRGLKENRTTTAFLAFWDKEAVGVAICFTGFSTFVGRPLINIHDLAVKPNYRRQGVGKALLEYVELKAREFGCCRLTLEVREDNIPAQVIYRSFGFGNRRSDGISMQFWEKQL